MKPRPDVIAHFAECKALADACEALDDDGKTEFNTLRAREMARAEARRQPPQPDLLEQAA